MLSVIHSPLMTRSWKLGSYSGNQQPGWWRMEKIMWNFLKGGKKSSPKKENTKQEQRAKTPKPQLLNPTLNPFYNVYMKDTTWNSYNKWKNSTSKLCLMSIRGISVPKIGPQKCPLDGWNGLFPLSWRICITGKKKGTPFITIDGISVIFFNF